MLCTWPMLIERFCMRSGYVTLMGCKSILRKLAIHLAHNAITGYFGDNRCGANRDNHLIALPHCKIGNSQTFNRISIGQNIGGFNS